MIEQNERLSPLALKSSEWTGLFKVTLVWMALSTILWILTLYYEDGSAKSIILNYLVVLMCLIQANPFSDTPPHRGTNEILTSLPHILLFLNPAITGLAYHALIHDRVLPTNADTSSVLCIVRLAGQSVMHLVLALKWITEAPIPWAKVMSGSVPLPGLWFFYNFFGWSFVDNIVFAMIYANLFRIARKERKKKTFFDDQEKGRRELCLAQCDGDSSTVKS